MHRQNLAKFQHIQKYLTSIDQWNARLSHIVIAEKDEFIQSQKSKNLVQNLQVFSEWTLKRAVHIPVLPRKSDRSFWQKIFGHE